ncbi:MAG TPA: hypothetical protein VFC13_20605, partial [Actinomycetes bacterium]|nr:hypothetical protein [Actinomycetes bacterium]
MAALLSLLLLGSLAALALIGSGGLPGSPVVPARSPLVREVEGSPVQVLPGLAPEGGSAAGPPAQPPVPAVVPPAVDEAAPPATTDLQQGGGQDGQGDQGGQGGDAGEEDQVAPPGAEVQPPGSDPDDSVAKESGVKTKSTGHEKKNGKGHQNMDGDGPGQGKGKGHAKHGQGSEPASQPKAK